MRPSAATAIAERQSNPAEASRAIDDASNRCRNCGTDANGHYCPNCGQETTVVLPAAGTFLREAAGRYVAFDGRLWRSLWALLFRPGFLTREYLAGRRRRYVRPSRLFVVLSIALFAILRLSAEPSVVDATVESRDPDALFEDADIESKAFGLQVDPGLNVRVDAGNFPVLAPLLGRVDAFNRLPRQEKGERLFAGVLRYAPYAAIGLLPVFALLLEIAYAGRSRRHPLRPRRYAAHLVFGAHNHAFVFLAASLMVLVKIWPLRAMLAIWMIIYALASMKAVYGGGWIGVVLRAVFVCAAYLLFFTMAIALLVLAAVTLR